MTPKPNLQLEKSVVLDGGGLAQIFGELSRQGFRLVGPTLREGRLVLGDLAAPDDLPVGLSDLQEPGSFRLAQGRAGSFFGCRVGQESWKKFLFPSNIRLFAARRQGPGWEALPAEAPVPRFAFIGVRACELAALEVHDRIFLKGPFQDPIYRPRREGAFIVAVNCTQGGGTCFCASMGTGPRAVSGFDLALTEVLEKGAHYFVAESGSERGAALLSRVEHRPAGAAEHQAIQRLLAGCLMGRDLDTRGLKEFLYRSYEHPHWDEVADRCLTCGNCVLVCPTCFCHSISDTTDISGETAERWRRWDTCYSVEFSYLHGGSVRVSPRARYRQWLTHKLAAWVDQFGCLGCVGCGRCLTWCPVGIDLTQEVQSLGHVGGGAAKGI